MKNLVLIFTLFFSLISKAGMLSINVDESSSAFGGQVRYFKIETQLGQPHLYLLDSLNNSCRVPIKLLKDLGIDPVQLALNLRNIHGKDELILTCFLTKEELNRRAFAHQIEITSWPRVNNQIE